MNFPQILGQVRGFMEATEEGIINRFLSLDRALEYNYQPGRPIIFVPGTRKDRVLLVAHYDTVWEDGIVSVRRKGYMLASAVKDVGIGADDRLGCSLLWSLRNKGHSLLLVPDEEIGCLGSKKVVESYPGILDDHNFVLQFDRRGSYDMAHYGYENPEFESYIKKIFAGYTAVHGTSTDIRHLMPAMNRVGFNLSIGFRDEHRPQERVDVLDYVRTGSYTLRLLSQKDLPVFIPTKKPTIHQRTTWPGSSNYSSRTTQKARPSVKQSTKHESRLQQKADNKIRSWVRLAPPALIAPAPSVPNGIEIIDPTQELPDFVPPFETVDSESNGTYGVLATMSQTGRPIGINPDGSEVHLTLDATREKQLNNNLIRVLKIVAGYNNCLDCDICGMRIGPELQYHQHEGDIDCGLCGERLWTAPDIMREKIATVHDKLLRDINRRDEERADSQDKEHAQSAD